MNDKYTKLIKELDAPGTGYIKIELLGDGEDAFAAVSVVFDDDEQMPLDWNRDTKQWYCPSSNGVSLTE